VTDPGAAAAPTRRARPSADLFTIVAFAILAACGLAFARGGHVQQDEGWYLTAARAVTAGRLPYRDFLYTQGPLHPYVYALGQRIFGRGLLGGRLTSWVLFLAATALAALTARRLAGGLAALITIALIGSTSLVYWTWTLPLTHAPAGFCLALALFLLADRSPSAGREAGALVALAAGTAIRVSLIGALVVAIAWIGLRRRSTRAALVAGLGAAFLLAIVIGPFALASPANFRFGVWGYHALRTQQFARHPGPVPADTWWLGKLDFLRGVVLQAPLLAVSALLALTLARRADRETRAGLAPAALAAGTALAVGAISMIPHPVHVTYAALLALPIAIAAGVVLAPPLARIESHSRLPWIHTGVLLVVAVAARLDARDCRPGELAKVRMAASAIDRALPPGPLLTFDNLITAENDRPLLPGLEMGPFAFWPFLSDQQADSLHVVNAAGLCRRLREGHASGVVMTRLEAGMLRVPCGGEALGQVLAREFAEVPSLRVANFGQYSAPRDGDDELHVFVPRGWKSPDHSRTRPAS